MKGAFCIPFVFWTRNALHFQHIPSAVAIQGDHVVTGGQSGEVCFWSIKDSSAEPRVIGTPGYQMPCKALAFLAAPCSLALGLEVLVLSIHADNRLRTWDVSDGKCVACSPDALLPKHVRIDKIAILEARLAALGGEIAEIIIVDCWIMSKIAVLSLGSALAGADYFPQGRMLAALTSESQLKFWALPDYSRYLVKDANAPQVNTNCVLQLTLQTEEKPRCLSMSPDGALVALAYESTISFIHRSWVRDM